MYKTLTTRTIQNILRAEQIRLPSTHNAKQREAIKKRISLLATELLYRWRNSPQILVK